MLLLTQTQFIAATAAAACQHPDDQHSRSLLLATIVQRKDGREKERERQ